MSLNPKTLGMAVAAGTGTLYLLCILVMSLSGPDALVFIFNGLFHGLNVRPILLESPGILLSITGFVNTIVLSWMFGSLVGVVYNLATGSRTGKAKHDR